MIPLWHIKKIWQVDSQAVLLLEVYILLLYVPVCTDVYCVVSMKERMQWRPQRLTMHANLFLWGGGVREW